MGKSYFSLDEDFEKIIKEAVKDKTINKLNQISTGWTNIVYEVDTNCGSFFFRFPRDDFWSRTIVKDYEFTNYIYGKTNFETVKLELLYDNGRPFSMHKKIEGTTLADKIESLNDDEISEISKEISKFMFELHNLDFNKNGIFKTNNIGLNLVDFLDELLNVHASKEDTVFWKYSEEAKQNNNCLVHGDFNLSNILLNENNHVSAIIDFGFAGFGNRYDDIARVLSRSCPENFRNGIVTNYEKLLNNSLDYSALDNGISTWKDIDSAYINYMRGIGIYE